MADQKKPTTPSPKAKPQPSKLPRHYSLISAQTGPDHDEAAHKRLAHALKLNGFESQEVVANHGHGHNEKSFLVSRKSADAADAARLDKLALEFKQESALHSDDGKNELRFTDGRLPWRGKGVAAGDHESHFVQLPSGEKIRHNVAEIDVERDDGEDLQPVAKAEHAQPAHDYGEMDGVRIFHALHQSHSALKGEHIYNPSDEDLKAAIGKARKDRHNMVIVHGSPPYKLLGKLHGHFGATIPGKASNVQKSEDDLDKGIRPTTKSHPKGAKVKIHPKSGGGTGTIRHEVVSTPGGERVYLVDRDDGRDALYGHDQIEPVDPSLNKAMLQNDKKTMSDSEKTNLTAQVLPKELVDWGANKLSAMQNDSVEVYELDGKKIHVRKLDSDLFSGHITTTEGNKIHEFKNISMPELMTQIRSKFEKYGANQQPANPETAKLKSAETPADNGGLERKVDDLKGEDLSNDAVKDKIHKLRDAVSQKLKELETPKDETVTVPAKDVAEGLLNPETTCDDCGNAVERCACYAGLPKPEITFDLKAKKLTILFKSEWSQEDKESFLEDLGRRAGRIIGRKK